MRSFADFLIIHYRGSEIWMKEKVQPLKLFNALFLEPHTRCYMMFIFGYSKSLLPILHFEQSVCRFSNTVSPPLAQAFI